jgi:uncharacterized protein YbjT (DUF2867 family)
LHRIWVREEHTQLVLRISQAPADPLYILLTANSYRHLASQGGSHYSIRSSTIYLNVYCDPFAWVTAGIALLLSSAWGHCHRGDRFGPAEARWAWGDHHYTQSCPLAGPVLVLQVEIFGTLRSASERRRYVPRGSHERLSVQRLHRSSMYEHEILREPKIPAIGSL